jgi:hypothetical protein
MVFVFMVSGSCGGGLPASNHHAEGLSAVRKIRAIAMV